MPKRNRVDFWLFLVALALVCIGLVMVFSASAIMASASREYGNSPYYFLKRQGAFAFAGILALLAMMKLDYRKLRSPAVVFSAYGITTALLLLVFFFGKLNGAHRWVRVAGLTFEPSELAKLVLVLFLAYFLESRQGSIDELRSTLLPAALPPLAFTALIAFEPDLGTAVVCFTLTTILLLLAGMRKRYLGYAFLASLPVFYFFVYRVPWRWRRVIAFIHPNADPQGSGFHIIQSLISVGTGGLFGLGLMEGKQKLFYLPEPQTDFIFAVIAEELGLIGAAFVVALFAILCYRGLRAAHRSRDNFARFLATGITAMIAVEAFFNISVVLGMLPTKGIPLPLISYGGSSLFVTLASVGILLNITQQTD